MDNSPKCNKPHANSMIPEKKQSNMVAGTAPKLALWVYVKVKRDKRAVGAIFNCGIVPKIV